MLRRTAEDRARFYALKAELHDLNAEAAAERREKRRVQRKATKAARTESPMKGQREPREKIPGYLQFIRRQLCVVCFVDGIHNQRKIEAAHVKCGYPGHEGWRAFGVQEKSHDWRTLPLCAEHHREGPKAQHNARERNWWAARNIHPPTLCALMRSFYDGEDDGSPAVQYLFAARRAKASQHSPDTREGSKTEGRGRPQSNRTPS